MLIERRKFLQGFASLLAAPAIVRFDSIMPVKLLLPSYGFDSFDVHDPHLQYQWIDNATQQMYEIGVGGWEPVPASSYNDQFEISGDRIVHGNCTLMQRSRKAVVSTRQKEIDAAYKLVTDWHDRYGGGVRVTNDVDYFYQYIKT